MTIARAVEKPELKPCPFCGNQAIGIEHEAHKHVIATFMPDYGGGYSVECSVCNVGLIVDTQPDNKGAAIAAWNRRALPPESEKPVAQLPTEIQKGLMREAMTEFVAAITGFKPPSDRASFPPEIDAAMNGLIIKWWAAVANAGFPSHPLPVDNNAGAEVEAIIYRHEGELIDEPTALAQYNDLVDAARRVVAELEHLKNSSNMTSVPLKILLNELGNTTPKDSEYAETANRAASVIRTQSTELERLRKALGELVLLKYFKERIEELQRKGVGYEGECTSDECRELAMLQDLYARRKPLAWVAARQLIQPAVKAEEGKA